MRKLLKITALVLVFCGGGGGNLHAQEAPDCGAVSMVEQGQPDIIAEVWLAQFPEIVNKGVEDVVGANLNATVIMIAEKAADMIRALPALPRSDVARQPKAAIDEILSLRDPEAAVREASDPKIWNLTE